MNCNFLAYAVLILCSTVPSITQATPFLLAELDFSLGPQVGAVGGGVVAPDHLRYSFGIGATVGLDTVVGSWEQEITASDVGRTFDVDPQHVAKMAEAWQLSSPEAFVSITAPPGFQSHWFWSLETLLASPQTAPGMVTTLDAHVSPLASFAPSAVTVTINDFISISDGNISNYGGGFTARFYGIPEPVTWLQIATSALILFQFRTRC